MRRRYRHYDTTINAAAERRARELLRETAGAEALEMYDRLGLLAFEPDGGEYGYLIYPHRPLVGYDARSGELLSEYCVRFADGSDPEAGERLPDADDVLAKWLALRMDEAHTLELANVHPLGRQLDPQMVRRDLASVLSWRSKEVGADERASPDKEAVT